MTEVGKSWAVYKPRLPKPLDEVLSVFFFFPPEEVFLFHLETEAEHTDRPFLQPPSKRSIWDSFGFQTHSLCFLQGEVMCQK